MAVSYVATVVELALATLRLKFRVLLEPQHENLNSLDAEASPCPIRCQLPTAAHLECEHAPWLGKGSAVVLTALFRKGRGKEGAKI
jgi:hypothetical protein